MLKFPLCHQIYTRFPFRSPEVDVLLYISFIDPVNLVDIKSISPLSAFLGLDVVEVDIQYKDFRRMFKTDQSINDPERFWSKVEKYEIFPLILERRNIIRILPHSSAACERIFSIVTMNKNSVRNRMDNKLLNSILYGKNYLKLYNSSCHNVIIGQNFIEKHKTEMYNFK